MGPAVACGPPVNHPDNSASAAAADPCCWSAAAVVLRGALRTELAELSQLRAAAAHVALLLTLTLSADFP